MKKILTYMLLIPILVGIPLSFANAANCIPTFRGNYTVEADCTWPGNYKVYGNIYLNNRIITVPTGITLGINLVSQKATFTTGKIMFVGTSKMQDSPANGYYTSHSFGTNSGVTNCPSGMKILNTAISNYQGTGTSGVSSSGTFYCGK